MNKLTLEYPLFSLGFRAFFALAGLFALLLIALWASLYKGSLHIDNYYPNIYWHAHEMLLGYSVAVIAGFLLTAVKNWTGIQTLEKGQLAGLCLLWIYGRLTPFYSELLPDILIAFIDFSFLPVLALVIAKPIIQAGKFKNLMFVGLLLLMTLGNGLIHAEILGFSETAWQGIMIIITVIIMMILVIAGRVFPFFTEKGLKGVVAIRNPAVDVVSVASSAVVFLLLIFDINGLLLFFFAALALLANSYRVAGWYVSKIWYVPLLWVLYLGYAWILLGFVFVALSAYSIVSQSLAIHAFTVGGIGGLTLGMMARVSLGHTGRALKASNTIAFAFAFLNVAALFRVIMPALFSGFDLFLVISIYFWLAAFSLFIFIYLPILTTPRIDGKQG